MKPLISSILLFLLLSCSEKKEDVLQIKSIFNIPENASENSLLHFGFRKTIPKESDFTIPEVYEYHLKNYSTYHYKKGSIRAEIRLIRGTIYSMRIGMDTTVWNKTNKKLSQRIETDTVYINRKHIYRFRNDYAEIAGYNYKCTLPLKKEDAWKEGSYTNPVTKKKISNYSKNQFYTVSLNREFSKKHQDKLKQIMKGVKTKFYTTN